MIRLLACLGAMLCLTGPALADTQLSAALVDPTIAVDVDYGGARVTLFAVSDMSDDPHVAYAVALVGPRRPYAVTRMTPAGKQRFEFVSAPAVLAVAAEANLLDIASPEALMRANIHARYAAKPGTDAMQDPELDTWREAFAALKSDQGLFAWIPDGVARLEGGLIRADINLPAAAPPGDYDVRIFMFRAGILEAEAEAQLSLERKGAENALFDLARTHPLLYGLVAVLMGSLVGLAGALMNRRD